MSEMYDEYCRKERIENKRKLLKSYRRDLCKKPTPSEIAFRKIIKEQIKGKYGLQFQKVFWNSYKDKGYIADFYLGKLNLIFEVDGGYHQTKSQTEYDTKRTKFFNAIGIEVVRVPNEQTNDVESCRKVITKAINKRVFQRKINNMKRTGNTIWIAQTVTIGIREEAARYASSARNTKPSN